MKHENRTRQCIDCEEIKPIQEFKKHGPGYDKRCADCQNQHLKDNPPARSEKHREYPDVAEAKKVVGNGVLLVDPVTNSLIHCQPMSIVHGATEDTLKALIRIYRERGFSIVPMTTAELNTIYREASNERGG